MTGGIRPSGNNTHIGMLGQEGAAAEDEDAQEEDASQGESDDEEDEFEGQVLEEFEDLEEGNQEDEDQQEDAEDEPRRSDMEEAAEQGAEDEGAYGEVEMRPLRTPIAPSATDFEIHCRTHIPFRDWCPICVAARGTEDPHRTRDSGYVRPGLPTICLDYKELKKGQLC